MIMSDCKPGDWVVYVPGVAAGDVLHSACERGTITSLNFRANIVFVRYATDIGAKATSIDDLVTAREYFEALIKRKAAP